MNENSEQNSQTTNSTADAKPLHNTVVKTLALLQENKCTIVTPLETIRSTKTIVEYVCNPCQVPKSKQLRDIAVVDSEGNFTMVCRTCMSYAKTQLPASDEVLKETLSTLSNLESDEEWRPVVGGWISSYGKAISVNGKLLTLDPTKDRYHIGGKAQYRTQLIAEAFKNKVIVTQKAAVQQEKLKAIEDISQVGKSDKPCVKIVDKSKPITVENLKITTHQEACENGRGSRVTERFKEAIKTSIFDKLDAKIEYKIIPELPDHLIFKDGKVYNKKMVVGGNRFLAFSESKDNYLYFAVGDKSFYVNRLVCMAFHPIEGKNEYKDYKGLDCNHKDGNTVNNHADNLEWLSHSDNMKHAYNEKLNKKVRAVLQYAVNEDKTQGNFIAEHASIAEASRATNVPEHRIRENAKNMSKPKEFIWKFKDESISEEWSKKYSVKRSKGKIVTGKSETIDEKSN